MSLWKIAWRSIQQRALASTLTGVSMGLGVALVVAVLVIRGSIGDSFRNNATLGYDMIVGAKGGKLQLVLNTVFYLSSPVENIPYSYYREFTEGKYKNFVSKAIPCCLGDYYDKFRVIGTTPEMFTLELSGGRTYECSAGEIFKPSDYFSAVVGANVARDMALKVGSKIKPTHGAPGAEGGHEHDPFTVVGILKPTGTPNDRAVFINIEGFYLLDNHARPVEDELPGAADHDHAEHDHADHDHADGHDADHDHDEANHAHDQAEHDHADADHDHADHEQMDAHEVAGHDHADHDEADHEHDHADHDHDEADHDHAGHDDADHDHEPAAAGGHAHEHKHGHRHHHHQPLPENQREVTAILLLTSGPPGLYSMHLVKTINKGQVAQAVLPIREIYSLFDVFVGPMELLLLALTVLIVVVAGIGILVSIYNSMSERRHEIAVMRALGASRTVVMLIVLLESILLSLAGGLFGWLLGHLLIAGLNPWMVGQTGVAIGFFQSVPLELVIIPGLIVLAAIVGYLPAMVAYRTDVAKALVAAA